MVGLEYAGFGLHSIVIGDLLKIQKHSIKCFTKIQPVGLRRDLAGSEGIETLKSVDSRLLQYCRCRMFSLGGPERVQRAAFEK